MTTATGPVAPEALLAHVRPGADIIVPLAGGEPGVLLDTIEAHARELTDVRIHQMHAAKARAYIRGELKPNLRHVSYFLSPATREAFWDGGCDLVPNHFSEVPAILKACTDAPLVLAQAAPMDRHGYFSLGISADYVASFIGHAPFFLQVNPNMPRTFGRNGVHISQVAGWVVADEPVLEIAPVLPTEADHRIAAGVCERVPDRACIQAGIGGIPNAVLSGLRDHRHLGVHTELLSDGVIDLVEAGVVTGVHKHLSPGKVVGTFALGTRRLYDFLHENTGIEMLPVEYVNDPRVIAEEHLFVSINATTEVDLLGQCASETVAGRYWSSSGGQSDFARGAMYSPGGKGFIVLRSTADHGTISRIRAQLTPGSAVTTLKNTVDHVVTEYGVAELRGRSIAQRARALISVAAPQFREDLEREAHTLGYLHDS